MYERHVVEMSQPFPKKYIHDDGRGNEYVPHHIVTQRLIQIFGKPPKIEILREMYDGDKLTGVFMRLTVPGFDPVEEAGEADNPQSKTNGARAKDACSDAIKRCAMRLGLGLHLWAQKDYFLHDVLVRDSSSGEARPPQPSPKSDGEVSPEPSKAKSSTEEPKAPVSSPGSPEEVETVDGSGGKQTPSKKESGAVEASSGDTYGLIATAMADKNLAMKVLINAGKVALEKNATPKDGITKQNVMELPEEILAEVVQKLHLGDQAA